MQVRVRMNNSALRQLSQAAVIALEQTAEAVKTDVIAKNVIPFDTGTMQNESMSIDASMSSSGKVSITVDTPYARRLYYHPEYNFKTDKNPDAQGKWFDLWIDGKYKDFAGRTFRELYRRQTGGIVH